MRPRWGLGLQAGTRLRTWRPSAVPSWGVGSTETKRFPGWLTRVKRVGTGLCPPSRPFTSAIPQEVSGSAPLSYPLIFFVVHSDVDIYIFRYVSTHNTNKIHCRHYSSPRALGRGERSRASDACEKRMRLLAWTERISHAEAMLSAAVNSSSLSLRLYIRYGSSISISIDLSLIHGILVVSIHTVKLYCNSSSSSGRRKPSLLFFCLRSSDISAVAQPSVNQMRQLL